jgi:hypothetical protein
VWQESFKAMPLWSSWMIWQKINYIHANPVKAGIVKSAKDYRWSSFHSYYSLAAESIPIDRDWAWPEDAEKLSTAVRAIGKSGASLPSEPRDVQSSQLRLGSLRDSRKPEPDHSLVSYTSALSENDANPDSEVALGLATETSWIESQSESRENRHGH